MSKRKKAAERPNEPLDTFSERQRGRGRPPLMNPSEIVGRAQGYRMIFEEVWDRLWPLLARATSPEDVRRAFHEGASPYQRGELVGRPELALSVLRERKFPERRQARINFLADSLAGVGIVTPRRSRDICAQWRAKQTRAEKAHRIVRYEYWVECSCGYEGRSHDHACPTCGAAINLGSISTLSPFLSGIDMH